MKYGAGVFSYLSRRFSILRARDSFSSNTESECSLASPNVLIKSDHAYFTEIFGKLL